MTSLTTYIEIRREEGGRREGGGGGDRDRSEGFQLQYPLTVTYSKHYSVWSTTKPFEADDALQ